MEEGPKGTIIEGLISHPIAEAGKLNTQIERLVIETFDIRALSVWLVQVISKGMEQMGKPL